MDKKIINKKGFSLIEILITIMFLGFLFLAVLESEALAIKGNYQNTYNLYAKQVVSLELSYAHTWLEEGNYNSTNKFISCGINFGNHSTPSTSTPSNCLSIGKINNEINQFQYSSYSEIPNNAGIFLYISQPTSSGSSGCLLTVNAYVLWNLSAPGIPFNIQGYNYGQASALYSYFNNNSTELYNYSHNYTIQNLNTYNNLLYETDNISLLSSC